MKAYRWQEGQTIDKPGAYVGVPMEVYHSGFACAGRSVSSTALKRVTKSLAHYWAESPYNPRRKPQKQSDALDIGQAAHCRAFEPEKFDAQFVIAPYADFKTKAAQEWRDEQRDAGRTVLRAEDFANVARMAEALREDETAVSLFREGVAEITYACQDPKTGIWLLTRPDWLPLSIQRGPSDYKTTLTGEPEKWGRQAFDLGYPQQVALCMDVLEEIEGARRPTFWMVAQEKDEPNLVECFRWEEDQIEWGRSLNRGALERLSAAFTAWDAACLEHPADPEHGPDGLPQVPRKVERAIWPGYTSGPSPVITPGYLTKAVERAWAERT